MSQPLEPTGEYRPTPRDRANDARRKIAALFAKLHDVAGVEVPTGTDEVSVRARSAAEARIERLQTDALVDGASEMAQGLLAAILDVADAMREQTAAIQSELQRGRAQHPPTPYVADLLATAQEHMNIAEAAPRGGQEHARAIGAAVEILLMIAGQPRSPGQSMETLGVELRRVLEQLDSDDADVIANKLRGMDGGERWIVAEGTDTSGPAMVITRGTTGPERTIADFWVIRTASSVGEFTLDEAIDRLLIVRAGRGARA